jgi:hypothetical protein
MKILCSLLLSCLAVSSAIAGDSGGRLRDPLAFCGHFVINDPDAAIMESAKGCCRVDNQIHDCRTHDSDE